MQSQHLRVITQASLLYLGVILIQRLGSFLSSFFTQDTVLIKLGENFVGMLYVFTCIHILNMWKDIYWWSQDGFKKSYLFLLPILYIFVNFGDFFDHYTTHILSAAFSTLFTGVLEELLCRGLVLALFIKAYKQMGMHNYLLKAVLMSSLLFGLAHLSNIIGYGNAAGAVVGQVFFATFIAVGFCAVYLCTRSIIPLIFIHAGINFTSFLSDAPDAVKTDTFMGTLPSIIVCLPLFVYGFILINKKRSEDLKLTID